MRQPFFTGACTALVTPFIDGKINYAMLEKLMRWQSNAGIKAIVLAGTTGESPVLSDTEKLELFRKGKELAPNDMLVIAGTGSNSTEHAVALSRSAQNCGVDALLVVAPYYNKGNTESLYNHFAAIANAVDIPVILYNVPSRTGLDIPVSVYQRLSQIKNVIGVKEASSDITKIAKIRNACPEDFYIWSGNDDQIVPAISVGAVGVISVLSNLRPFETQQMARAALTGDRTVAAGIQCGMTDLIGLLFAEVNPIPVKYAMKQIGYDCGECRPPLGPPSELLRSKIDQYLQ